MKWLQKEIILKWLQDTYGCEVVTFTADIGQGEEVEPARTKALQMGVPEDEIYICLLYTSPSPRD